MYDYRAEEIHYKKLRLYLLLFFCFSLSILINIFIFSYYHIKINYQQQRNEYLLAQIDILNEKLIPIDNYREQLKLYKQQYNFFRQLENKRVKILALLQQIIKITPPHIFFTQISLAENNKLVFSGISSSPLFLMGFLTKLKENILIFDNPILKSNKRLLNGNYEFSIITNINEDLPVEIE